MRRVWSRLAAAFAGNNPAARVQSPAAGAPSGVSPTLANGAVNPNMAASPFASVKKRDELDSVVQDATKTLLGVARSATMDPALEATLADPIVEIVKGKTPAQIRQLANAAFYGEGTRKDPEKAAQLWVAAGMEGDAESLYSLALCMAQGIGIKRDPHQARVILEELSRQGHGWSSFSLATMYAQDNPDAKQQRKIYELYKHSAERGVAPALLNVANCLLFGKGTAKDQQEGLKWLKKAVGLGDPAAQAQLAQLVTQGVVATKDEALGMELYKQSAAGGSPIALYNVGCAYLVGGLVERDLAKAASYFERAAQAGMYPAMVNLGNMLQMGHGVPQDFEAALRWYDEAAKQTPDAVELADALRERMGLAAKPDAVARRARKVAQKIEATSQGLVFERTLPQEGVPTMEITLQVDDPKKAAPILEELQSSGASTAAEIMRILDKHRAATGGTGITLKAANGRVIHSSDGKSSTA